MKLMQKKIYICLYNISLTRVFYQEIQKLYSFYNLSESNWLRPLQICVILIIILSLLLSMKQDTHHSIRR